MNCLESIVKYLIYIANIVFLVSSGRGIAITKIYKNLFKSADV